MKNITNRVKELRNGLDCRLQERKQQIKDLTCPSSWYDEWHTPNSFDVTNYINKIKEKFDNISYNYNEMMQKSDDEIRRTADTSDSFRYEEFNEEYFKHQEDPVTQKLEDIYEKSAKTKLGKLFNITNRRSLGEIIFFDTLSTNYALANCFYDLNIKKIKNRSMKLEEYEYLLNTPPKEIRKDIIKNKLNFTNEQIKSEKDLQYRAFLRGG